MQAGTASSTKAEGWHEHGGISAKGHQSPEVCAYLGGHLVPLGVASAVSSWRAPTTGCRWIALLRSVWTSVTWQHHGTRVPHARTSVERRSIICRVKEDEAASVVVINAVELHMQLQPGYVLALSSTIVQLPVCPQ